MELEALLEPVTPESPSGVDLDEDGDVSALTVSAGSEANLPPLNEPGVLLKPGTYPFWAKTSDQAKGFLRRSKDLRLAVILAYGGLYTEGLKGFASVLEFIRELVQRHWATLYPPLDGSDPSFRLNSLARLNALPVVLALRRFPLVTDDGGRSYCLNDIERAKSDANGDDPSAPTRPTIEGALRMTSAEGLGETRNQIARVLEAVQGLQSALKAAAGESVDFGSMRGTLESMAREVVSVDDESAITNGGGPESTDPAPARGVATGGTVRSRQDVIRVLDQICSWYQANEPSSPVPLLLQRAKRLVTKNFFDAIRDLAPSGVSDIERIAGPEEGS